MRRRDVLKSAVAGAVVVLIHDVAGFAHDVEGLAVARHDEVIGAAGNVDLSRFPSGAQVHPGERHIYAMAIDYRWLSPPRARASRPMRTSITSP